MAFWAALARRALVENRGLSVEKEYDVTLQNKVQARAIVGTKDTGSGKTGYLLVMVVGKRYVYTFEAWGEQAAFAKDLAALEASAASMDVGK